MGNILIETACLAGDLDTVKTYTKNHPENKRSEFLIASCSGSLDNYAVVKFLVESGYPLHKKAFLKAIQNGLYKTVKYLLSKGAEVNYYHDQTYPLVAACESGNLDIIKLLLANKANLKKLGKDCLQVAIQNGHYKVVKFLLSKGVIPYTTSLHEAAAGDNTKIVKLLVKSGINVDTYINVDAYGGYQYPLDIAENNNNAKMIACLLELKRKK